MWSYPEFLDWLEMLSFLPHVILGTANLPNCVTLETLLRSFTVIFMDFIYLYE